MFVLKGVCVGKRGTKGGGEGTVVGVAMGEAAEAAEGWGRGIREVILRGVLPRCSSLMGCTERAAKRILFWNQDQQKHVKKPLHRQLTRRTEDLVHVTS